MSDFMVSLAILNKSHYNLKHIIFCSSIDFDWL